MRTRGSLGPDRIHRRAIMWCVAAALVAVFAAGCGSSDEDDGGASTAASSTSTTGSSGENAAAQDVLDKATAPIGEWDGFGEPFEAPSGKHIVAIECSSLGVGCVQAAEAAKEAGGELGWKVDVVNGKGDPTVWNASVQNAIAAKVDGIMLVAISPALVEDGIAKAKAAGIPVVATLVGPPADGLVVADPDSGGKAMAAYLATASAGKGDVLVLNDAEFVLTDVRNKAMVAALGEYCAECKTKTVEFTFATMPTKLAGQVASALQANPNITHVVAPFDAAVTFVRQGIQQAGGTAKVASFEGDPPVMKTIGDGTQVADLAIANNWVGWQGVDDLARLISGNTVKDVPLPMRLFTEETKDEAVDWDGDLDYRSEYRSIWGR